MVALADHSTTAVLEKRLMAATKKLQDLAPMLGYAKTVREYNPDQRKNALSQAVVKFLKDDYSVAAAEHMARALPEYQAKINEYRQQHEEAEKIIAEQGATQAAWDTCRSLLAMARTSFEHLSG